LEWELEREWELEWELELELEWEREWELELEWEREREQEQEREQERDQEQDLMTRTLARVDLDRIAQRIAEMQDDHVDRSPYERAVEIYAALAGPPTETKARGLPSGLW